MDSITLTQTVKHVVTFYVDDFKNEKQFKTFVNKLKTDDEFMINHFLENVDKDNLREASDIMIEE